MTNDHAEGLPAKTAAKLLELSTLIAEAGKAGADQNIVLANAIAAQKRLNARAQALSGEWEAVEIVPQQGPVTCFAGRLLGQTQYRFQGRDLMQAEVDLWETRGGALVAVESATPADSQGEEFVRCQVFPADGDDQARQFAVLDFFHWNDRVCKMVRKSLGWTLSLVIE